jgi:hypothetical protein
VLVRLQKQTHSKERSCIVDLTNRVYAAYVASIGRNLVLVPLQGVHTVGEAAQKVKPA